MHSLYILWDFSKAFIIVDSSAVSFECRSKYIFKFLLISRISSFIFYSFSCSLFFVFVLFCFERFLLLFCSRICCGCFSARLQSEAEVSSALRDTRMRICFVGRSETRLDDERVEDRAVISMSHFWGGAVVNL